MPTIKTVQDSAPVANKKQFFMGFLGGAVVLGVVWFVLAQMTLPYRYSATDSVSSPTTVNPAYDSLGSAPGSGVKGVPQVVGNAVDRTVTTNYVSVHVKKVTDYAAQLSASVVSFGGKIMSNSASEVSSDGSQTGTLQVLVPNKQADAFLKVAKDQSIKVVDQSVTSYQITKQYTDLERQLAQYETTYAKVLEFYKKATSVTDLMSIQSQLDSLQQMIDSVKGQKQSLDELSQNTQFTVYMSTNEFNLPYVPQGTFEFANTFKLAVRSLVLFIDKVSSAAIYMLVYLPVVALVGFLIWVVMRVLNKKKAAK